MKGLERQNRDSDNFPESDAFRENFFHLQVRMGEWCNEKNG